MDHLLVTAHLGNWEIESKFNAYSPEIFLILNFLMISKKKTNSNCGYCGNACANGVSCSGGYCQDPCANGVVGDDT